MKELLMISYLLLTVFMVSSCGEESRKDNNEAIESTLVEEGPEAYEQETEGEPSPGEERGEEGINEGGEEANLEEIK